MVVGTKQVRNVVDTWWLNRGIEWKANIRQKAETELDENSKQIDKKNFY